MPQTSVRHIGLVVPDLEAAQQFLTETVGITWGPAGEFAVGVRDADGGARTVMLRVCLSVEEPRFELIEEEPGTPWVCNEFSNLHHIALWTDDMPACSDRMSGAACPFEMSIESIAEGGDEVSRYHRAPLGLRFEITDIARREAAEAPFLDPTKGDRS